MTAQHPLSVIISDRRRRAAFCLTAARVALCGASAGGEGVSVPPPIGGDHDRVGAAVSGGGARAGEGAPGSRATGATAAVSFSSEEDSPEPSPPAGPMLQLGYQELVPRADQERDSSRGYCPSARVSPIKLGLS